jgi:hypothetical protein
LSAQSPWVCRLATLSDGMVGMTPALGSVLMEAAAVCLEHRGHRSGVSLRASGSVSSDYEVEWQGTTDQIRRTHNDLQEATERGACGLAILLIHRETGKVVVERSRKGTGFDYWIGQDDYQALQGKARLEVSGILDGGEAEINSRVAMKLKQISRTDGDLPGYVAVVEFSQPKAHIELKRMATKARGS